LAVKTSVKRKSRIRPRVSLATARRNGPKGENTRQRIIEIARSILVDEGYEKFVVRRISARAGIMPGNLQYYFQSKKELLQAVLEPELARYHETYAEVSNSKIGKDEIILAVINFLLQEIRLKSTCNIWYTVWALAPQDKHIAALMDDWYQQYMGELQKIILAANPALGQRRAGHIASILTAIMDGLTMQIGYGKVTHAIHEKLEDAVRRLFLELVQ